MSREDITWHITIQSNDDKVIVRRTVPNDELEYGVDDVLAEAREQEENLPA